MTKLLIIIITEILHNDVLINYFPCMVFCYKENYALCDVLSNRSILFLV